MLEEASGIDWDHWWHLQRNETTGRWRIMDRFDRAGLYEYRWKSSAQSAMQRDIRDMKKAEARLKAEAAVESEWRDA